MCRDGSFGGGGSADARPIGLGSLLLLGLLLGLSPCPAPAQRVVPSRAWVPTAASGSVDLYLRAGAAVPLPIATRAGRTGRLYVRVVGFRADSLLVALERRDTTGTGAADETLALAASAVDSVGVQRHSRARARRATGGETALYTGLLGGLVGAVAGGRNHRWQGVAIGVGSLGAAGYLWGFTHPYTGYDDWREVLTLRVEP